MSTVIVDYGSGNLRSAEKAFLRMAEETGAGGQVRVASDPEAVLAADRVVLPGVGAFADCWRGLHARPGLAEALVERVIEGGAPFLGVCVGMQMMASVGREHVDTNGFDWIPGEVVRLTPSNRSLKIPHMGWNDLALVADHPLLAGVTPGDHAYFVHSYHFQAEAEADVLAAVDYGGPIAAVVGRDNLAGTQFHPEKSQATGLRLIANFLNWRP